MVVLQFVTVEGCTSAPCTGCDAAEDMLRHVIGLAGAKLPVHEPINEGESYLADGRTIEAIHLDCKAAIARGLDPAKAPFLFLDGKLVVTGEWTDQDDVARRVLKALLPYGLADARP